MPAEEINPELKAVYCWNYYSMRFLGIWPKKRRWNEPTTYIVTVPLTFMLIFVCIPQTVNLPRIRHNLYLVVENLTTGNVTISITVFKVLLFWRHGSSLKTMLEWMAMDWSNETDPDDRKIMQEIARITRLMIMTCTTLCFTVIGSYVVVRRFAISSGDNSKLFFRADFPYNISVSPNYEVTFIGQLITSASAGTTYTAIDTFIVMMLLHICGQLAILKKRIIKIHTYSTWELQKQISKIVQKHNHLNNFSNSIEDCFNGMLLLQMMGCSLQMCLQCFQVIVSVDEEAERNIYLEIGFLFLFITYGMIQLYLYCYVGQKLLVESTDIAESAYGCIWYTLAPSQARMLLVIIQRARVPLQISAGGFCIFTLELYSQVLKTTMGYVSFLVATKGN